MYTQGEINLQGGHHLSWVKSKTVKKMTKNFSGSETLLSGKENL